MKLLEWVYASRVSKRDKKLRIPAEKAINIDIANEASNSSWPSIFFPFRLSFKKF